MFCTESCEHGMNATSSGRVLGQCRSSARMQQEPIQMGQVVQQGQTVCLPQQPRCTVGCVPVSGPNFWLDNNLESTRLGMCFVTERPEGLSIDCRVPIPSNFNLGEGQRRMLKPPESPQDDFGLLLMESAMPPCPCFPRQDIGAVQPKEKLSKKNRLQHSCRKCVQKEQQKLQRQQQPEQSQPVPQQQQQQSTDNTSRGVPPPQDSQLISYLESIVEILLAKKASYLQNQDQQAGQSSMETFGLVSDQQVQQNDQQNFDHCYSNSPQMVPPCECAGILPTAVQASTVKSAATASQPVSPDRSAQILYGSAPLATKPQSSAPKSYPSSNLPNKCLVNGSISFYSDVETQTSFNFCPTFPTRSPVWHHRPCCSHCFWYPTTIQR